GAASRARGGGGPPSPLGCAGRAAVPERASVPPRGRSEGGPAAPPGRGRRTGRREGDPARCASRERGRRRSAYEASERDGRPGPLVGGAESKRRRRPRSRGPPSRVTLLRLRARLAAAFLRLLAAALLQALAAPLAAPAELALSFRRHARSV